MNGESQPSLALPSALNRTHQRAFLDALDAEIRASDGASLLGLLVVQLRGIDELNFSASYRAVDTALTEIAVKLDEAFAQRAAVVRIGTSRFAILLRGIKSAAHATLAAGRVERIAEEAAVFGTLRVDLVFVQGIALYPLHADDAERLLQCAETALVVARNAGQSVAVYRDEGTHELQELRRVEDELSRALEHGGVEVYFQPQIDAATGRAVGAEALLRCRDRRGAMLSPEAVVAAAERTHRLAELTSAVLNTALRHAAEWPVPGRLSVNISTYTLKDADFPALVGSALGIWGRAPSDLTIEITETAFIEEPERSLAAMRELKALGVRVAIDDFGTGYSSLSYFTNIPANELKVDKSFVFSMLQSDGDRRIVQAVVNLAHGFDLEVVAEGVEDRETFEALRAMGCNVAQGFWIGRPMAPAQYADWVASKEAEPRLPLLP